MSKYIGCWFGLEEAAEENGEVRLAHAYEAANDKQAKAKATLLFMEAFPDADDSQFEFRMYAEAEGVPCPVEEWDEEFLFDYEWNEQLGHPVAPVTKKLAKPIEFDELSESLRVATLVKYHSTEINSDQLRGAIELQQDDSSTFDSHIYLAITKTPAVASMYSERILEAIDYVRENCAPTKKWPEIKGTVSTWLKKHEADRQEGMVETIESDSTESTSTVVPRPYNHTHTTLDVEIATALWAGDVDPNAPQPSVTRWANGIIKEDRDDFKRWSIQLRTQPNILKYDRPTIFGVVRNVPAVDTYRFPESHKRYITEYLKAHGKMENGDDETEQNTAAPTGSLEPESPASDSVAPQQSDDVSGAGPVEAAPPVDGPFYFLKADGKEIGRANKRPGLEKALADGGTEISQEEYQARKNGTYQAPQETADKPAAQPEVTSLGGGRFSIDNLMGEQPKTTAAAEPSAPSNEGEKTENEGDETTSSFTSRAEVLTKELNEKTGDAATNLSIWKRVHKTDPARTKTKITYGNKRDASGNLEILRVTTSINPTYQEQRATELFGPFGIGWGVDIVDERFDPGIPFMEPVYDGNGKFLGKAPMRNADGSIITTVNHTIRINLWYIHNGVKGNIPAYGHTKYIYQTKSGATCDDEFAKKSLTDATTKALSKLGFSADVYTGLFDDSEYKEENAAIFDLRNASEKAEEVGQARKELDERFKINIESMRSAPTPKEVSDIASSLTRVMGIHLKSAKAKADKEYEKYLDGRLRRLEEIKTECLKKLQEKAA